MSFSSSSEISIDVVAVDDASAVLSTVQGNLTGLGTAAQSTSTSMAGVGVATQGTTTTMVGNISAITQVTAGFTAMAFSIVGLERSQVMLDRANIMVERDTLSLEKAQAAYNSALEKTGPNSLKTQEAAQALSIAQQKLAMDTDRASVAQQNFDLQIVQMGAVGIPMFLMGLAKLPAAYAALSDIGSRISIIFTGTATEATAAGAAVGEDATATTALAGSEVTAEGATAGFGAALGTVGTVIVPLIVSGRGLVEVFGELSDAFKTGTVGSQAFFNSLSVLTNPIALAVQGIESFMKDLGVIPQQTASVSQAFTLIQTSIGGLAASFTSAFSALPTIITGALGGVVTAVTSFLNQLKTVFQDFYNFLVGGSLWVDLWNRVVSITQSVGGTIAGIITGLFTAWEGVFSAGMQAIQTILTIGFQAAFAAGKTIIQAGIDFMKTLVQGFITVVTTAQTTWAALFASVSTNTALMKKNLQDFMDWALPFWTANWQALADTATNDMLLILNAVKITSASMASVWSATMASMASQEKGYFETIVADISAQVDAIIAKLNAAQHRISHGSIWPDMFTAMVAQTKAGMADIQDIFASSLTGSAGIVPMLQTAAPAVAGSLAGAPAAAAPAGGGDSQALNITVPIYLDGQQISTHVEKRLVKTLYQNTGRSRRTSTLV